MLGHRYSQGQQLAKAFEVELLTLPKAGHNNVLSSPHWDRFDRKLQKLLAQEGQKKH